MPSSVCDEPKLKGTLEKPTPCSDGLRSSSSASRLSSWVADGPAVRPYLCVLSEAGVRFLFSFRIETLQERPERVEIAVLPLCYLCCLL